MVLRLAEWLGIPLRQRNETSLAAGYATLYSRSLWRIQDPQSRTFALEYLRPGKRHNGVHDAASGLGLCVRRRHEHHFLVIRVDR